MNTRENTACDENMTTQIFKVTKEDADDIYSSFHNPDGIYYLDQDQLGWYWQEHDGEPVGPFDTEQKAVDGITQ